MNNFKSKFNITQEKAQVRYRGNHSKATRVKLWCVKRDRSIAALTAVVVFTLLLSIVIYTIFAPITDENPVENGLTCSSCDSEHSRTKTPATQLLLSQCQDCSGTELHCSNVVDLTSLVKEITQIVNRSQGCDTLVLSGVSFPNYKIPKGWLEGIPYPFFKNMRFEQSVIEDMDNDAFSGDTFKRMNYLRFGGCLSVIKRDWFAGTIIQSLEIDFSELSAITIESQSLNQIKETLKSLQLVGGMKSDVLVNLTGSSGVSFPYLKTLNINLCNKFTTISEDSFTNVGSVEYLSMDNTGLKNIEANSFSNLGNLIQLQLSNNELTYLPPGIFDSISNRQVIFIASNKFKCNCELVWFRDFYTNNNNMFVDRFYCFNGTTQNPYEDVTFCEDNNSTTTSTLSSTPSTPEMSSSSSTQSSTPTSTKSSPTASTKSSTTTSTSTESSSTSTTPATATTESKPDNLIALSCRQFPEEVITEGSITTKMVQNGLVEMKFVQNGQTSHYKVVVSNWNSNVDLTKYYLLATNCQNKSDYFCSINIHETDLKLDYANTYTFCLLEKQDSVTTISPYDCTSLSVPEDWDNSTWIPHKDMFLTLSCAIVTMLLAVILSALTMFYCIRQHPNLIKGNKRVIIVESRAADAIVMPKNYEHLSYRSQSLNYQPTLSLNSYSDGYLTPKIYERITSRPGLGTISEQNSMRRMPYTYTGTSNRIRRSQIKRRMRLDNLHRFGEEELYEPPPPPLPPNHPHGWMHPYYSHV